MIASPPFWLTHFPPAFEPYEVSKVSIEECSGQTAATPKLAELVCRTSCTANSFKPQEKKPLNKKKPNFGL